MRWLGAGQDLHSRAQGQQHMEMLWAKRHMFARFVCLTSLSPGPLLFASLVLFEVGYDGDACCSVRKDNQ